MIWEGREESLEKTTGGKKIEGKNKQGLERKSNRTILRFKRASQSSSTKFGGKHYAIQGI